MLDDAGRAVLKLRVSAAAADGAANAAVVALLAKALQLPKSAIRLAGGAAARVKRIEIDAEDADVARAFGNPPAYQKL